MVLNWLGGRKPDHPLADDKSAREALAALPKADAAKAIEEVRDWIESINATEDFKPERRAELILMLDEAAHLHHRKLAREYLSNDRLPKFQEATLWRALAGLWSDLAGAYMACLDSFASDSGSMGRIKARLPLFCTRSVHALACQLKWQYLHYEPVDAATWGAMVKVHRFAEGKKVHRESIPLYPGLPQGSSVEREFLQALMLAASAPDCLMPVEIELAEWIVAHFSGAFLLTNVHKPQETYNYIDMAQASPPKRLTQAPPASPGLRFFAAGQAAGQLDAMIRVVEGGGLPSDLNLGGTYDPPKVLAVLRHLKMYWASTPPVRKTERYEVKHRLTVVHGLEEVLARLQGTEAQSNAESWVTENISSGGVGAIVSNAQGDWLGIGKLVGLAVEGGSGAYSIGMVRRCTRLPRLQANVGIRTFARSAFPVSVSGREEADSILVSDSRELGEEVSICMREGGFDKRDSPTMLFDDKTYLLIPIDISVSGDEFEVGRYRAMLQS